MNDNPGIYVLIMPLLEKQRVKIGRLGTHAFEPGWYVYIGSAFGPGGVLARTNWHRRTKKRKHWHVDYLRAVAPIVEIWRCS